MTVSYARRLLWVLWTLLLVSYLASFLFLMSVVIQNEFTQSWDSLTLGPAAGFQAALIVGCKQFVNDRKLRRVSLISTGIMVGILAGVILFFSLYLGLFYFLFLYLCWAEFFIAIVYYAIKLVRMQKY